jgi:hypothetical protein
MIKHLLISFLALSITATAQAGFIDSNPLPTSLEINVNEDNDDIFLFKEQENFALLNNLDVDYLSSTAASGAISAGTNINSFFLSFDAVGKETDSNTPSYNGKGTYTFDTEILGIIWGGARPPAQTASSGLLDKSDSILGVAGTTYLTYDASALVTKDGVLGRGLELDGSTYSLNQTTDGFKVTGRTLDITLWAKAGYTDQLRVITAVPEPSTLVLFGAAVLCLLNLRRVS